MNKQILCFTFFLLMCLTLPLAATAQVVSIPDPNLRTAIENALGTPAGAPITTDDMATLTQLDARHANISDLTGLEDATNLASLTLWGNNVSDISAIAGLTKLTRLILFGNSISDISVLAGLTNLTGLGLGRNSISDISAIAGLTKLTGLGLGSNSISDISALSKLTNLKSLNLWENSISNISALSRLANLKSLDLRSNLLSDISALAKLTNLTTLYLQYNNISDISAVAGLTKLTTLYLGNNNISDISAVAGLTKLTRLGLGNNNISDISPLVANTGLGEGDTVDVPGNPLSYLFLPLHTHIPILQSRGVTVKFEDRTHLNVGEPYTVRLIYFLSSDRQPKPDIDTQMDTLIKEVQQLYANEMERYGFGRKTFAFETDMAGNAVVHHVDGQFTAEYYEQGTFGKVHGEIIEQFDTPKNIYLVVVDSGYPIDGVAGKATVLSRGAGGVVVIHNIFDLARYVYLTSHELRHTFGLTHDFSLDPRGFTPRISRCTAEWLDVHRYFNASRQDQNISQGTIKMLPPSLASPSNPSRFRFEVADADGLHQAQLLTNEVILSGGRAGGFLACKRLTGTSSTVEFVTTALTPKNNIVSLQIVDMYGNITGSQSYPIDVASLLPRPEVVSIPDANLAAAVRETLGLSPGAALTTHTMLDLTGLNVPNRQITDLTGLEHAHNLKWLNLGSEWVSGSRVNSNAVSNFSPLLGLTQLTRLYLWFSNISDISMLAGLTNLTELNLSDNNISDLSALSNLTNLTVLDLEGNNISDLSVLSGLTNLTELNLSDNNISDLSVLSGLTNLIELYLWTNNILDISPLAGLTNLTVLDLYNNSISDASALAGLTQLTFLDLAINAISDVSALAGLTQLTRLKLNNNAISDVSPLVGLNLTETWWDSTGLYLQGNPLSYAAINTHIPAIQAKGVEVKFDNRTPTTLVKILGAEQQAAVNTALPLPFVVEVRDERNRVFSGVPITFAVTAGGGTLSVTNTTTDENGRAQSTLTLGPNPETNTVEVSTAGIKSPVTFNAAPAAYLLSVPAGISLIHVPLKVTAIDGVEKTITSISDLYDALGGSDTVNFLITYDSQTQQWFGYFSPSNTGTADDRGLTNDTGIIAGMITPVTLRLIGNPLGTNGSSTITLNPGFNLVGLPLKDPRITRVSDLFALDGIGGNVHRITLTDSGKLKLVERAGDPSDIPIIGGQSFFLRALRKAIVVISGDGWYNASGTTAAPLVGNADLHSSLTGIQVTDTTPVLGVRGSIVDEQMSTNRAGFRVIVKNLSTSKSVAAVTKDVHPSRTNRGESRLGDYQVTIVDVETGRAATIGDILEISAQSPNPLIGVKPLRYTVTAEDVKQGLIRLTELIAYEIPTETALLANYPNPFNPETWIPYRLAEDAFVTLTIYDGSGHVVHTLEVGHQIASAYESRSKAIHWNGTNGLGEQVASGVYFYHLSAGDFSATRRMLILK